MLGLTQANELIDPVDKFVKQMRKKQRRTLALFPNTLLGVYNYFKLIYTIV